MTHRPRIYIFVLLVVLAAAAGTALYFTAPQEQPVSLAPSSRGRRVTPFNKLVDQQPLQTAQQLDKLATTREEARYSRQAVQAADHEVDLAFTSALRNARLHPPAETPETKQLHDRIRQLQAQVTADQDLLNKIKAAQASARGNAVEDLNDQQQLAAAELALHQDELDDAKRDLMRAGGDDESRIQRLFAMHEASQHSDQQPSAGFQMRSPFEMPASTVAQLRLMWQLHRKRAAVLQAQQGALSAAKELSGRHDELENQLAQKNSSTGADGQPPAKDGTALASIRKQAENRKLLTEYDERVQDFQQLAQSYSDWGMLLHNRVLLCLRAVLEGLLWILGIVTLIVLGNMGVDRLSQKLASDRRRMATMRLLGHFAVQAVGLLLVVFVLVGPPNQLSTIIAFAGAGLTVALKDFIVAFFGWFVLMGKNGIRVGDWVEINGIGGEVVEIGLLRTVLLETGNWAESGHPTGRRVTFVNSFAIEGHYFNFSTSGQWLWDRLELLVPTGQDPYPLTDSLLDLAKKESELNAREAEKEWSGATRDHGMRSFSAEPALSLRPNPQGTTIIVRYITRANERYATRTRLNEEIVQLLHRSQASAVQVQTGSGETQ
jgi:small-conductance mechanosensitive channel